MSEIPVWLDSEYEKMKLETWNAAIEAAAQKIGTYKTYEAEHAANEIRKLKK